MVPGLWVNEGGQSVTGKLVRVESNGNELLSRPADCYNYRFLYFEGSGVGYT